MGWGGGGVGGGWGRSGTEMMIGSEKVVVVVAGRSCVWDEGQEEKERVQLCPGLHRCQLPNAHQRRRGHPRR